MDGEVLNIVSAHFFTDISEFLSVIHERGLHSDLHWYLVPKPILLIQKKGRVPLW